MSRLQHCDPTARQRRHASDISHESTFIGPNLVEYPQSHAVVKDGGSEEGIASQPGFSSSSVACARYTDTYGPLWELHPLLIPHRGQ